MKIKYWSSDEIELAKGLIIEGLKWNEIGNRLGRTAKAVRMKMNKKGFTVFKPQIIEKIKCKNCEKEFKAPKSHKRTFCSRSCTATFNNKGIVRNRNPENVFKPCKNCGKEIYGGPSRKYCNHKCQHEYAWRKKKEQIELGNVNSRGTLRRYLFEKDGHKCRICENTKWNNENIPVVLDHINGDPYNDLPSNLRLICCNCDAQTEFYKSKNKGRGRKDRMKRYYDGKSY